MIFIAIGLFDVINVLNIILSTSKIINKTNFIFDIFNIMLRIIVIDFDNLILFKI